MPTGAGRFAPSPTGPLHFGSLTTALGSWLDARTRGERWLLRIDDIDTFRIVPGADRDILTALEAHGLTWDGEVQRQTGHAERYENALDHLKRAGLLFYCRCSRRNLKGQSRYPGTCRSQSAPLEDSAVRVATDDVPVAFDDELCGHTLSHLNAEIGDFVVRRRDGLIAYQLATAVDDGADQISRVVRGRDLLDNTSRQIWLMRTLGLTVPEYAHLPVVRNPAGDKLSKQSHAPAVDPSLAATNLLTCLGLLGLQPPRDVLDDVADILAWALQHWDITAVRTQDPVL